MNGYVCQMGEPNSAVLDRDVTKKTVENAESRARLQVRANSSKPLRGNNRQYAQALHRQADELCQRDEYESALVLYHRAATICPHDSSHSVAARRTAAMISSWNNPEKSSARVSASMKGDTISKVTSCSENVAHRTSDASKSSDLSIIPDILRYLDISNKTSHETFPALGSLTAQLNRSKTKLKHINSRADAMLKNLEANFDAGKMRISLRLAEDLVTLSSGLGDPRRHTIPAYRYLSLIHAALGRHDRATNNVATLVRLSRSTNDDVLLSQALVTMGKVHLTFGFLEAAARAWENVSIHIDHPVPRAWLHHEIGRCHFERGKYAKALRKAAQCLECAEEANSKKWIFHAGLLRAQCLVMLGRFAEALEELRVSAKISEEDGDTGTLSYVQDLIEQLNRALREVTFGKDRCSKDTLGGLSPREKLERYEGNEPITTFEIKETVRGRDDNLVPSLYSDYVEDNMFDRREIDEESSSLDSAMSFRSKKTNLTYVIESRMDLPSRSELDEMKIHDKEMAELLSHEAHITSRTRCYTDSEHLIGEETTSASLKQPDEACSSNVGTNDAKAGCGALRISKSCEGEQCNSDTTIDGPRRDASARYSDGYLLLSKTRKLHDEEVLFIEGSSG